MISKNKIKLIHSLESKKQRAEQRLFVAEGVKCISELMDHYSCRYLAATAAVLDSRLWRADEITEATQEDIRRASLLQNPQDAVALFELPDSTVLVDSLDQELVLVLDHIQDPGNMGTIIRLANWFGIQHIVCSLNTVDLYNPKIVQASMGALSGVHVYYTDIISLLQSYPNAPIYGTFLEGDTIYQQPLSSHGFIIMGNEGNGIGDKTAALVNKKLYIPSFMSDPTGVESLNVATAAAIILSEFRRR